MLPRIMMLTGMTTVVPSGLLILKANPNRAMPHNSTDINHALLKVLDRIHLFRFLEGLLPQATSTNNTRVMLLSKPLTSTMLHLKEVRLPTNRDLSAVTDVIPLNTW